jgi:hypothetical protein
MPGGTLALGTTMSLGVTDFFQVGTDIYRDFYKVFNAHAKISLIDYPDFAMGLTGGWESYNFHDISNYNPDVQVTSWQPGVATAYALHKRLALFVGGHLSFTNVTVHTTGDPVSGLIEGAAGGADLSWAYNPPKKRGIGNVLSGGVTYDFTYRIFGFGVSHHWRGFHIGLHYYPQAADYKVLPIISGGVTVPL